jgi:outer membrane protein OmpA-like peptidoglycan-associated protein
LLQDPGIMAKASWPPIVAGLACLLLTGACASKRSVGQQIRQVEERLEETAAQVERDGADQALAAQQARLEQAAELARLAGERAREAEQAARGQLPLAPAYTVEGVSFASGGDRLSPEAVAILDQLAARLALEDQATVLEIQGHTDDRGGTEQNLRLGRSRAEAVRRYLHTAGAVPLHTMQVISLGASRPLADNASPEGRARNRRVDILVLRAAP